jgi:hypothetical protein
MKTNRTSLFKLLLCSIGFIFSATGVKADPVPVAEVPHETLQQPTTPTEELTKAPASFESAAPPVTSTPNVAEALAGEPAGPIIVKDYNPEAKYPVKAADKKKSSAIRNIFTLQDYVDLLPREKGDVTPVKYNGVNPPQCPPIDQLTFVGFKFIGDAHCVPASSDAQASAPCAGGEHAVNPGNPQYGLTSSAGNTRDKNTLGYYYCVADDIRNSKKYMCEQLAPLQYPGMRFKFGNLSANGDGDCLCAVGREPQEGTADLCNNPTMMARDFVVNTCRSQNPYITANPAFRGVDVAGPLSGPNTVINPDKYYCTCSGDAPAGYARTFTEAPPTNTSCGYNGGAATTAAAAGTVQTNDDFSRCLSDFRQKAMDCQRQSEEAKNTCKEKIVNARNSPLNMAGSMVNAAGQMGINANAGSGNQQNCFGAGVGLMGTRQALKMGQASCDSDFAGCQRTCSQENLDRMAAVCPAKLRGSNNQPLTEAQLIQSGGATAETYQSTKSELQQMFQQGREVCTRDAGGSSSDISNMLSGLGNAARSSLVCACNLNSSPGMNCASIPTIDSCETNPAQPNCQVYSAVDTCNPTSVGYNQQQCKCLQNPTSCSTISGQPGPSMFGGNLASKIAPSGGGGGAIAGGVSGGAGGHYGVDAGGGGEQQAYLGGGASLGSGGGGGGGAAASLGGGMGGGGNTGNGALIENGDSEKKGIGGFFTQLKNAVAGAFGKGSTSGNGKLGPGKGGLGGKDDLSRFKPRGLASAGKNGIGTANMDIFGMIKLCATGETCISNQPASAWILTP